VSAGAVQKKLVPMVPSAPPLWKRLLARALRILGFTLGVVLRVVLPWPFLWKAERTLHEHGRAQVMIAQGRKVLLLATLPEFAAWSRLLTDDEAGRGRRIAVIGKATVAIRRLR
jgi:hypothetical protein